MTLTRLSLWAAALSLCAVAVMSCSADNKKAAPAPGCAEGARGCACGAGGQCDDALVCFNQLCVPPGEVPGNNGEADLGGDNGQGDLEGDGDQPDLERPDMGDPDLPDPDMGEPDLPDPVEGLGLEVTDANARACEVVLIDPEEKIAQVLFTGSARGRSLRRGERVAVAFHASADSPLEAGDIGIALREGAQDLEGVGAVMARCFGFQGELLGGAAVRPFDRR